VNEFNYPVHQCFLTGFAYARFYIRDAMRAIDYLQTRHEVDPRRIGMGGLSWGGWQCSIASALDPRIVASASAAGINETYRRLLQSKGVGSAGKYPVGFIAAGLDKPDFFTLIAPRAFMRVSTTRDYKPIQGARESYDQYRRAFEALGAAEKLDFTEDDFGHGYTPKNNEAIYRFYGKHLAHPGPGTFVPMEMMSEEDMRITPTGQVATSMQGAIAFDYYREEAVRLLAALDLSRQSPLEHIRAVPNAATRLAGVELPRREAAPVFLGRHQREGHAIEMYVLQGEAGYVIPMLLFVPNASPAGRTIIYLHPQGKSVAAKAGGDVDRLVRSGYMVAVPDLAGTGETRTTWGDSGNLQSLAGMMNRSLVGLQAGDIMRVRAFLVAGKDHHAGRIGALAFGSLGPALLHAAVLDHSIASLVLVDAPLSYRSAVMNRHYKLEVSAMVPKALTAYDLPDLVATVAPRRVALINPRDHLSEPADAARWEQELAFSRAAYERANVGSNLTVTGPDGNPDQMIRWALE
jgi:dienelactone hydrolase